MRTLKLFLLILVLPISSNFATDRNHEIWPDGEFIELRINQGRYQMIRLLEEGLICRDIDSNQNRIVDFIPLKDLNINSLIDLQTFLKMDFFRCDIVLDDPLLEVHSYYPYTEFIVGSGRDTHCVKWVDGDYLLINKCLLYVNSLIPDSLKGRYAIH